ncbi:lymphocyte antigen 6I-like [Arvicola amphibius]|uniref:lymphocyte antigen 6I-like n=1 Tax=Arvicola amphibius TaxID=1047088 RepID=UPI001C09BB96|nr:lymphocyte antigen 6I-like [Arvicola amphibius]
MTNSSHTMKTGVLILLVSLLFAEKAQGLRCYQCSGFPIVETSCQPVTCPYTNGVCVTQEVESTMGEFSVARMKMCSGVGLGRKVPSTCGLQLFVGHSSPPSKYKFSCVGALGVQVCGAQRLTPGIFLEDFYLLRQGLLLNPKLADSASLAKSYKMTLINKFCLPTCPDKGYPGSLEFMGISAKSEISCCNTDLCSAAGATGSSIWTLAGVLLFSLGSVLLQAWL